jgi:membrane glycosyltransferase
VQIFLGRDAGWKAQSRDGVAFTMADAVRFHWRHMLTGAVTAFLCWEASPGLLVWMSPVLLGLILSGPINWFTAQPAGPAMSVILSTPVDRAPASILLRALRHTGLWRERLAKSSQTAPSPDPAAPELKAA